MLNMRGLETVHNFTKIQTKKLYEIAARTPSVLPFLNDNPDLKRKRIRKATGEGWAAFSFYCQTYLPHVFPKPFCPDHQESFEITEKNIGGLTAITGYRGFGKTVLMGLAYQLWKLTKGEDYIVNVAADEDLSEERTAFIYNELQKNKRIQNDFPDLTIVDGVEDDFYLRNNARIRARSIRQAIRGTINPRTGSRPGLIDGDDVDKEDNIGNWTIGKRKLDKIRGECIGALDPDKDGRVVWKGNLTHPNFAICQFEDLLTEDIKSEDKLARPENRKHLIMGNLQLLRYPVENEDGTSRWPEQYSDLDLVNLRKTMGMVNYLREMLGRKIIEGKVFKWEWFKRHSNPLRKKYIARLYADLAPGEKNCYKAVVGGIKNEHKYYITNLWVRQGKNSGFFRYYYDTFWDLRHKYGTKFRASVEGNFDQYRSFCRDFDLWCDDNHLPRITQHIKKYINRGKKTERIESLETIIEQGKIILPEGQDSKTLIEQFLSYPDGYLDGPDATEGWLSQFPGYNPRRGRARVRHT